MKNSKICLCTNLLYGNFIYSEGVNKDQKELHIWSEVIQSIFRNSLELMNN